MAFIHRGKDKGGKYMHVLNSAEGEITDITGIREVENSKLKVEGMAGAVYDLSGRSLNTNRSTFNTHLPKGVYILNGKKVVK